MPRNLDVASLLVPVRLVYETHSISEDNERGVASGWNHSRLSKAGQVAARQLGQRRRNDGIHTVFTSDLGRAVETAEIAFGDAGVPILHDWRLRECDYGELNGAPKDDVHGDRRRYADAPYPGGETWRQAIARVGGFLDDLRSRWDGQRVLVIGHVATRQAFDHFLGAVPIEEALTADFAWQEGWEYSVG
jgi:2,3-bisphosphoglycerate-dependent phosphoglycerate mutase